MTLPIFYSRGSACVQCRAIERWCEKHGVVEGQDYTKILVEDMHPAHGEWLRERWYATAPVMRIDDDNHFAGFQPDKLAELFGK